LKLTQALKSLHLFKTVKLSLLLVLLFSACSSMNIEVKDYEKTPDYVASPYVDQQLKVKRIWGRNVGAASDQEFTKLIPSVSEQAIFTVSAMGHVTAWNHNTFKRRLWSINLNEEITGGLFEGYGLVLLATSEGKIYALNSDTGETVWAQELVGEVLVPPQGNGRIIVVQMANGVIQGLDFKSGEKQWVYKTTVPALTLRGTSIPVIENQIVYSGFANGKVVALDVVTGSALWEMNIFLPEGGTELEQVVDVDGSVVLDTNSVYAATYQGKVVSLYKKNGRPLWKNNASNYLGLEKGLNQIYSIEDDGSVNAYNSENGEIVWSQDLLLGRQLSAPSVQLNYLVVGDLEGYLYWIRQSDGEVVAKKYLGRGSIASFSRWNFKGLKNETERPTDFRIFSKAVVKDGVLYLQNQFGAAAAYKIVE
jgi:outer membrane protein assembly factor BamB